MASWSGARSGSTREWRRRRAWWQTQLDAGVLIRCPRCGEPVTAGRRWHLDHYLDDDDDEHTSPAHPACNIIAGYAKGRLRTVGHDLRNGEIVSAQPLHGPRSDANGSGGMGVADDDQGERVRPVSLGEIFDLNRAVQPALAPGGSGLTPEEAAAVPWLAGLFPIPPDAAWPRLMSAVHPRATGSYGWEAIAEIEQTSGRTLWWWQRLLIVRALEHDAAGKLVWRSVGLSVPRQQGKSTAVGELASWRLQSGGRFGGPQNVLLVARDVGASVTVQKPHRLRAEQDRHQFKTSAAGGRLAIEWLADGSEWLIRSSEGVYSYSAVMAVADEAWDLAPSVVDDGLHPVILQQSDAQLWVVSTANPKATGLMLGRRAAALAELGDPSSTLWMEWSAHPDADIGDPHVWPTACPRWTSEIAERYVDLYTSAMARRPSDPVADDPVAAFASQYLNRWPSQVEPEVSRRGEPLVDLDGWAAAEVDAVPLRPYVLCVDSAPDGGTSVAVAANTDDGRVYVQCETYERRSDAFANARRYLGDGSRLLTPKTLTGDPALDGLVADEVSSSDLPAALLLWRELLAEGRLCHFLPPEYGPCQLTVQLAEARVATTATGLSLVTGPRHEAVRAALWAVRSLCMDPVLVPAVW